MAPILLERLLATIRAADDAAGKTNIKPAGMPWRQVYAIPADLWDAVRAALEEADEGVRSPSC